MGNSRYCIFVIMITQLTTAFILGVSNMSLNSAAPAVENFIRESYKIRYHSPVSDSAAMLYLTLAQSIVVWGCVIGALAVLPIFRKLSPRISMLLVHAVNVFGAVLSGPIAYYSGSYELLIIGRLITGIARGMGFSIVMMIVAESSIRSRLGFYQAPFYVFISLSGVIGAGLGHSKALGQPVLWVWLVSLPSVASFVYIIAFPWIPETPMYYLRRDDSAKAIDILRRLRTDDVDVLAESAILKQEIEEGSQRKPVPIKTILKSPDLRLQFITTTVVLNTLQLGGVQAIELYSDAIMIAAGVDPAYVTFATMGIHGQTIFAFALFFILEKKIGTRRVFIIGIGLATVGVLLLAISNGLREGIYWMNNFAVVSLIIMMFGMQLGPLLTMQSLPSELTTSATRLTVVFYATSMFWTIAAVTGFVFPYAVNAYGTYAYVPYVVICFSILVFGILFIPETHQRTNADIQKSFRKKCSLSVVEILNLNNC